MTDFTSLYSNSNQQNNSLRDRYGRDRYYNSFNTDIFQPVLSHKIVQNGFRPHYPGNKKIAVCVSHDVDHLFSNNSATKKVEALAKNLLKGRFDSAGFALRSFVKKEITAENSLQKLKEVNEQFRIQSSYYFLSLDHSDEDFNYNPADIKDELRAVLTANCEVGLHGGHRAYNDLGKLLSEKKRLEANLGSAVKGYRNHYLRFELPLTWKNLESAGFLYDTTFCYADCVGFRNGMCYPFYPYDVIKNEFVNIIELPLIMMDATLFYYMRLDEEGSLKLCRKIVEEIAACNGVFTLLWHNNFISGEMGNTYRKILELLTEYDPWFATSADLTEWWRQEKLIDQSHGIVQKIIAADRS